jgi:hypothetical protein
MSYASDTWAIGPLCSKMGQKYSLVFYYWIPVVLCANFIPAPAPTPQWFGARPVSPTGAKTVPSVAFGADPRGSLPPRGKLPS